MSSINLQTVELFQQISQELHTELKLNKMATPGLKSLTVNIGMGKFSSSEKQDIMDLLEKLVGQKPLAVKSKKSIANFKSRKGELIATKVDLRGLKANNFLLQTVYLALPRTRDFKGVSTSGFDKKFKSFSFGIPSTSIFPAIGFSPKVNFGLQITLVFKTADENNKLFLQKLHFPFKK
jgi:large subunit ribosomal protein L5